MSWHTSIQDPYACQEPALERLRWAGRAGGGCPCPAPSPRAAGNSVGSTGAAGAGQGGFCAQVKCKGGESIQAAPAHGSPEEQEPQRQRDQMQKVSELWTMMKLVSSSKQTSCPVCIPDFYLCISISQLLNAFGLDDIWYCCLLTLGPAALTLLLPSDIYMDTDVILISIMGAKFMTQH